MDNYPSLYEYPPPPYQFERAHVIYSYDPHDAQYTNEPPPYANEPYKQSYFEDPYHNNPPLHSFDGNEFQERELQEEWNALKNDTLQPLKQMEEQLAFMMKELTTRTQGEDHASTLGSGETIPEISVDSDNDSSYSHGIFYDACEDFDCGDEEMVCGNVEGVMKEIEFVTFDNDVEGGVIENEMRECGVKKKK
nr:hypothetical protein Iba_scaffold21283CG0010 [Ipomoea batatas]GME20402.1 hypothetical protein Iba_scaffold25037CG0110 [Ipomoea batatas]